MTTDLEELLRSSDPAPGPPNVALLALDVAREVSATHRRPFLSSRKRRMLAFSTAALVLVPGAAIAATVHFTAETGQYGKSGMTENDTSQYIDMCATDIQTYVQTLAPTTRPLPTTGVTWSGIGHYIAAAPNQDCPPNGPGVVEQVTGLKAQYLSISECSWEHVYLEAQSRDDVADQSRAASEIASAENSLVDLGVEGDDGWKILRNAAVQGDSAVIERDYHVNCTGSALFERTIGAVQK